MSADGVFGGDVGDVRDHAFWVVFGCSSFDDEFLAAGVVGEDEFLVGPVENEG